MTAPSTLYSVTEGVATITLNEPENRNALSDALVAGLLEHLGAALDDEAVRVVVVTNNGSVFCAGADLKAARSGRSSGQSNSFVDVMTTILDSPKPMLVAIDGHCSGGGVGLAAAFDISVARDDVKFGFTEARLGVAPAIISVVCLPKMNRRDASELFLRAGRFPAQRAAEVGLINYAVPAEHLEATVGEIVGDVVRGGPGGLAAAKQLILRVPGMDRADAFAWTAQLSTDLFNSDEAQAGMAAFLAKEPAPWVPGADG